MRTSVVMCTYNGERYVEVQLESLLSQTTSLDEIIVADDCSTDATFQIVCSILGRHENKVLIRRETRSGFRSNFLNAVKFATGEIVFFCDQDDVWSSNKVREVVKAFESNQFDVVSHDFSLFGPGIEDYDSAFDLLASSGMDPAWCVDGCAVAFRKAAFDRRTWPSCDSGFSHDRYVAAISELTESRLLLRKSLMKRRIHGNNAYGFRPGRYRRITRFLAPILGPSTSWRHADRVVSRIVTGLAHVTELRNVAAELGDACIISSEDLERALRARHILELYRKDPRYADHYWRCTNALFHFLSQKYRPDLGAAGFLADVMGKNGV